MRDRKSKTETDNTVKVKVIDISKRKEEHGCSHCIYHGAEHYTCNHPNYGEIIIKSKAYCVGFTRSDLEVHHET